MISVTILTKNSTRYLRRVLEALKDFAEILVLDTGSTDDTIAIAQSFSNVKVYEHPFEGFGKAHNLASSLATYDWILSLDSDEIMTADLAHEVLELSLSSNLVYSIPRNNYYRGKFIKGCGWYPDRVVRLYNRKATQFSNALVHEKVLADDLKIIPLKNPVLHFPYNSIEDFLSKMQLYSSLFAQDNRHRKASLWTAISHALFTFIKSYFIKRGFLLGSQGLEISIYNAVTVYYKYLKLRDLHTS